MSLSLLDQRTNHSIRYVGINGGDSERCLLSVLSLQRPQSSILEQSVVNTQELQLYRNQEAFHSIQHANCSLKEDERHDENALGRPQGARRHPKMDATFGSIPASIRDAGSSLVIQRTLPSSPVWKALPLWYEVHLHPTPPSKDSSQILGNFPNILGQYYYRRRALRLTNVNTVDRLW